jgi:hypothetical protein
MDKICPWLNDHQGELLALLEGLVNIDSGSYCKEGIDRCGDIHAAELRELGSRRERSPRPSAAITSSPSERAAVSIGSFSRATSTPSVRRAPS